MWRLVMYLPSCPARGESFTIKCMAIVGSEIFWKGMGLGFPENRGYPRYGYPNAGDGNDRADAGFFYIYFA